MDAKYHEGYMEETQEPGTKTKCQESKQKKKIQELRAPMQTHSAMGPEQNFLKKTQKLGQQPLSWQKQKMSASSCIASSECKSNIGCVAGYLAYGCGY